jgi:hypothetical protein
MTKWVEVIPLPNQESVTIADALIREVICRYGLPREIISDQGPKFHIQIDPEYLRQIPY